MGAADKLEKLQLRINEEQFEAAIANHPKEEQEELRDLYRWLSDRLSQYVKRCEQASRRLAMEEEVKTMLKDICPVIGFHDILANSFIRKAKEMSISPSGAYIDVQTVETLTKIQLNCDKAEYYRRINNEE